MERAGQLGHGLLHEKAKQVVACAFSLDGRRLACGGFDRTIPLWDLDSARCRVPSAHAGAVRELAFSPDGAKLASCSLSDDGRLWDAATRTALSGYDGRRAHLSVAFAPSGDVAYSLDGRLLAAGADDWAAYVSDAPSRELASLFRAHAGYVNGGEFSPDGTARSGCGACRPPEGRETGTRRRARIVALWCRLDAERRARRLAWMR